MATVFVTQYALTAGIKECEVVHLDADGYVYVEWRGGVNGKAGFSKGQWAETREKAIMRAEELRVAKIASLRKQIAKLEKLKFDVSGG